MTNKKTNSQNNRGNATNNKGNSNNNKGNATNNKGNATNNRGNATNNRGNATNNRGNATNNRGNATNNKGNATNNKGNATNNIDNEILAQNKRISNKVDTVEVSNTPEKKNMVQKIINPEAAKMWQERYKKIRSKLVNKIGLPITMIIIYILISVYIYKLESQKCVCSISWEQKVIKVLNIIYIIHNLFRLYFYNEIEVINGNPIINNLLSISYVLYLYCLYTYTNYLKYTNCRCAITKNRNLYLFTNTYIKIVIISIIIIIIIGGLTGMMWSIKLLTTKPS
jgi:hypothetical protein